MAESRFSSNVITLEMLSGTVTQSELNRESSYSKTASKTGMKKSSFNCCFVLSATFAVDTASALFVRNRSVTKLVKFDGTVRMRLLGCDCETRVSMSAALYKRSNSLAVFRIAATFDLSDAIAVAAAARSVSLACNASDVAFTASR